LEIINLELINLEIINLEFSFFKSKVCLGELVKLEPISIELVNLFIDISLLILENFSGYLDYYSPMPKVIIIIINRSKLANIRVILDIGAEVNIISLDIAVRFEILIIYNMGMAL
jgi:hypothetical protein